MKMFKKVFAVVLCVALFATLAVSGMAVSAEEITKVDGVRWFPCPVERQNDDAWEVECVKDGCLCQRFTETAEDTGNSNFLDTVYGEDGSLTITRNGNDQTEGNYWPRIRTISLETSPELDLTVANTLYFNFDVAEGTQWNFMLSVNGINVKLSKAISDAAGFAGVANSDADGVSGHFEGKIDLQAAFEEISKEVGTESAVNAMAIMNMGKTFIPQVAVFCVGPVGASLTLNELFISTADDATGANCRFVDMGVLTGLGDEYYDLEEEEPVEDEPVDEPVDEPADEPVEDEPVEDEPVEEDKKDDNKKDDAADNGGDMTWLWIVLAVVAVAVVAAVVVIVMKKKNA